MASVYIRSSSSFTLKPPVGPMTVAGIRATLGDDPGWIIDDKGSVITPNGDEAMHPDTVDAITPILNELLQTGRLVEGDASMEGYDNCDDYLIVMNPLTRQFEEMTEEAWQEAVDAVKPYRDMRCAWLPISNVDPEAPQELADLICDPRSNRIAIVLSNGERWGIKDNMLGVILVIGDADGGRDEWYDLLDKVRTLSPKLADTMKAAEEDGYHYLRVSE